MIGPRNEGWENKHGSFWHLPIGFHFSANFWETFIQKDILRLELGMFLIQEVLLLNAPLYRSCDQPCAPLSLDLFWFCSIVFDEKIEYFKLVNLQCYQIFQFVANLPFWKQICITTFVFDYSALFATLFGNLKYFKKNLLDLKSYLQLVGNYYWDFW